MPIGAKKGRARSRPYLAFRLPAYIQACMYCDPLGATTVFETVLGWVTQSSPDGTEYLFEQPVKCPYCRREIHAKTLVIPK